MRNRIATARAWRAFACTSLVERASAREIDG